MNKKLDSYISNSEKKFYSCLDILDVLFARLSFVSHRVLTQEKNTIAVDLYKINSMLIILEYMLKSYNFVGFKDLLETLSNNKAFFKKCLNPVDHDLLKQSSERCKEMLKLWIEVKKNNFSKLPSKSN